MNDRRGVSIWEYLSEVLRLITGTLLAILMLIPALVIRIADKITMWRLRRRNGPDPK